MNRVAIRRITLSIVTVAGILMFVFCLCYIDIILERKFIQSVQYVKGEDEGTLVKLYGNKLLRRGAVVMLTRRRTLAPLWKIVGGDESVAVYLTVFEGKVSNQMFTTWFPSMKQQIIGNE